MTMKESNTETILIFGGSGFIGSHFISSIKANNTRIIVADIKPPKHKGVDFEFCDVRKPIKFKFDSKPTLVVVLAAIHKTPGHSCLEYFQTNVGGIINIINWCEANEVDSIFFASSIAVYGPGPETKNELDTLNPTSSYGLSKQFAEHFLILWQKSNPINHHLIICRPSVIFGEGENGNFTRLARALRFRYFLFLGNSETFKSCGYVKDLVDSIFFVRGLNLNSPIIYNFCYPKQHSLRYIVEAFNKVAGYRIPPNINIRFLASFLELNLIRNTKIATRLKKLSNSTAISPQFLLDHGFHWKTDITSGLAAWRESNKGDMAFK